MAMHLHALWGTVAAAVLLSSTPVTSSTCMLSGALHGNYSVTT